MKQLLKTTQGWFVRYSGLVFPVNAGSYSDLIEATESVDVAAGMPEDQLEGELVSPIEATKVVLVGLNFLSHAQEAGGDAPEELIFGGLPASCVTFTDGTTARPAEDPEYLDYEGEIAVVIGKDCENVEIADADSYILGLTACIDFSARGLQMKALQSGKTNDNGVPDMTEAKAFDKAKPLGPEILLTCGLDTSEMDIALTTKVNGELRQSGHIKEMIFPVSEVVSTISKSIPLKAGDIICTGTPAGVAMATGNFLVAGDKVEVQVGQLEPLTATVA